MKLAITSQGRELNSRLDERFGRCRYFIVFDSDTEAFEPVENQAVSASGGAGVQSAQLLADRNVDVLITGHVGPNAIRVLRESGIEVYAARDCTVKEAIEKYKNGELQSISSATVGSHFGSS